MNARLSASLILAGLCNAIPAAHADDVISLPATQIEDTNTRDDTQSQGYQGKPATSTTKMGLTNQQTPQAITTITRAEMDDFKITGIKDALRSAPSVTVEQSETDRTEFTSRGFDITSFEFDGMGMPFAQTLLVGDQDMAEFEQLDVLHGANGLMSGTGNPSATVNFVRKRPTDNFQAQVSVTAGSFDSRREDVDVSGPLTPSGNVRGRFIYAHEKGDSWMDRYSHERTVAAGLLAFDLSAADTLTVGFSQHDSDSNGSSWGNLPLVDANNVPVHYSGRSANIGQDWTYWDVHTQRAFAELKHDFGGGWNATVTATGITEYQDTNMAYVGSVDADDASVFAAHTSSRTHEMLGEAKVTGPFSLLGRDHELTVGAAYGRTHQTARETDAMPTDVGYYTTSFAGLLAGTTPEPSFQYSDPSIDGQNFTDTQKSLFAAGRFSLTDDLHWIAGARLMSLDGSGDNYGSDHYQREHGKVTPYTGLVYDINDQWTVYTSWTKIFSPQYAYVGFDGKPLDPLEGKSLEAGVKGSLMDRKLDLTAAVFKAEQDNAADTANYVISGSQYLYGTQDYKSHGVELQASGEALPGLELLGGYTYVRIDNEDGDKSREYVPTHSFHGMATYRLPGLPKARIGTRVSWQSATQADNLGDVRQNAYALVDLMASYDIDSHWNASLNFDNITDRKYLLSLYSQTAGSYGAPRNVSATLTWKY
ncbi:TonB-dependent siderophore receptor [Pseudomonas sp. dw_358]|uniref:TonB-dependent siderophore receptor n=1 Tax=Pseudomonas sp. dw_358 TaxID=2720083 RepID=UPI001C4A2977|nr:TonB-dependent siderophore receptor [Pseudomonas sp. dw_358]